MPEPTHDDHRWSSVGSVAKSYHFEVHFAHAGEAIGVRHTPPGPVSSKRPGTAVALLMSAPLYSATFCVYTGGMELPVGAVDDRGAIMTNDVRARLALPQRVLLCEPCHFWKLTACFVGGTHMMY